MALHEILQQSPTVFGLFIFTLSLLVGSFLNVVIHRLPIMMEREWHAQACEILEQENKQQHEKYNLSVPASACPFCGHQIKWYENIPVISYLFLKGQCSKCSKKISPRYPIVEFITAVMSVIVASKFGYSWATLGGLVFTWALIALTMIDADTQLLPDGITMPLLWLGLIANFYGTYVEFDRAFFGAIAGYLSLWSVYWAFKLLRNKEGMGYGDFKLLAALGAWLGWTMLPLIIILSSVAGALWGGLQIVLRKQEQDQPMPFGPYLAAAGWVAMIWGDSLLQSYLQLFSVQ